MKSEELKTRVSKYKYTTGFIGATGGWHYTQLDKALVVDESDKAFFDNNVTDVNESGYFGSKIDWEDKWTFDGCAGQILNYTYAGGVDWSYLQTEGSTCSPTYGYIYGYAKLALGKDKDGNILFGNDWGDSLIPSFNLPMTTGITFPLDKKFEMPVYSPFPYLEMCGT
jgi:hypothetical protein